MNNKQKANMIYSEIRSIMRDANHYARFGYKEWAEEVIEKENYWGW